MLEEWDLYFIVKTVIHLMSRIQVSDPGPNGPLVFVLKAMVRFA